MENKDDHSDPLEATVADLPANANRSRPEPPRIAVPDSAQDATLLDARTRSDHGAADFTTMPATEPVGSYTTTLAATSTNRIKITIPDAFLSAGTPGSILRLIPVEQLRGKPAVELYFKTGAGFALGRSPEADWITLFSQGTKKTICAPGG